MEVDKGRNMILVFKFESFFISMIVEERIFGNSRVLSPVEFWKNSITQHFFSSDSLCIHVFFFKPPSTSAQIFFLPPFPPFQHSQMS